MCIDIFRFGDRLDIEFLAEQIWFSVREDNPAELDTTQVYDVLIKNPKGCQDCTEVYALFPHSCLKDSKYQIDARPLYPPPPSTTLRPHPDERFNWLFNSPTRVEWGHDGVALIARTVDHDSPEAQGRDPGELVGIPLSVHHIGFPNIFEKLTREPEGDLQEALEQCKQVMARDGVRKTLVRIPFDPPLRPKEKGWFRLIVRPVALTKPDVKRMSFPGITAYDNIKPDDYAVSYEQKMEITCPLYLRRAVLERLADSGDATQALWSFVNGLTRNGTTTRIEDHRLALIVPRDTMDIYDAVPTTRGVVFNGTVDLPEKYTAHLWTCGSCCNEEDDLIHNAMRVLQKVALVKFISYNDLATQLAPSTKFEAFSHLLSIMKGDGVKMITVYEDKWWVINDGPPDVNDAAKINQDCFDFNALRLKYVTGESTDHDWGLMKQFRDLHPFRILFRVVWSKPTEKCGKMVSGLLKQTQA